MLVHLSMGLQYHENFIANYRMKESTEYITKNLSSGTAVLYLQ